MYIDTVVLVYTIYSEHYFIRIIYKINNSSNHYYIHIQYLFDEGRIVELNNQAKHSVINNMSNKHRVHLIFDYIDDHIIKQRFTLKPGEIIHQTRRSIDLEREVHTSTEIHEKSPSFIIIGAQVRFFLLFLYIYSFFLIHIPVFILLYYILL